MKKILVVEDNQITAKGLVYLLDQAGYRTLLAHDATAAQQLLRTDGPDLAILDVTLPGASGYDLARSLHREQPKLPFIFLTAKDTEEDIVRGLELGASDFVTKPFHSRELLLRVRNALVATPTPTERIFGELHYNLTTSQFSAHGQELDLTALERRLLGRFLENSGQILTRQNLLDEIYDASGKIVNDNTVSVYLKRLRTKLAGILQIKTVKNLGYRLEVKDGQ